MKNGLIRFISFLARAKPLMLMLAAAVILTGSLVLGGTTPAHAGFTGSHEADIDAAIGIDHGNDLNTGGGSSLSALNIVLRITTIIARAVGIILAAFAIFKIILGMKDQDPNEVTKALITGAIALALIVIPGILNAVLGFGGTAGSGGGGSSPNHQPSVNSSGYTFDSIY